MNARSQAQQKQTKRRKFAFPIKFTFLRTQALTMKLFAKSYLGLLLPTAMLSAGVAYLVQPDTVAENSIVSSGILFGGIAASAIVASRQLEGQKVTRQFLTALGAINKAPGYFVLLFVVCLALASFVSLMEARQAELESGSGAPLFVSALLILASFPIFQRWMRYYAFNGNPPKKDADQDPAPAKKWERIFLSTFGAFLKIRRGIRVLTDPVSHIALSAIIMIVVLDLRTLLVFLLVQAAPDAAFWSANIVDTLVVPIFYLPILSLFVFSSLDSPGAENTSSSTKP